MHVAWALHRMPTLTLVRNLPCNLKQKRFVDVSVLTGFICCHGVFKKSE